MNYPSYNSTQIKKLIVKHTFTHIDYRPRPQKQGEAVKRKKPEAARLFKAAQLPVFYFLKELYSSALSDSSPEVAGAPDSPDVSDELSDSRASVSAIVSTAVVSDGIFAILAVIIPSTLSAFML